MLLMIAWSSYGSLRLQLLVTNTVREDTFIRIVFAEARIIGLF